ncbi:MAG: hypothetical protein KDC82_02955 [Bacteroidetes bacterium]|nr:hypothetical protein [Bacteroidota bacterium]
MRNLIVLVFMTLMVISCSKDQGEDFKAKAVELIGNGAGGAIAKVLECKQVEQVKIDFKNQLGKLAMFQKKEEKAAIVGGESVGSSICTVAVSSILPFFLQFGASQLPSAWECSGEDVNLNIQKLAEMGCANIKL